MAQRPFNDAFANLIAAPLNLTHTFMSTPADDALGVIVDGDGSFYQDLGDESPYVHHVPHRIHRSHN